MHPTGKRDLRADVTFAKRIAIVRAIHAMPTVGEWEIRASVYVWGTQTGSLLAQDRFHTRHEIVS
jgi:hypothetical protein